jgi:hypothetical protein
VAERQHTLSRDVGAEMRNGNRLTMVRIAASTLISLTALIAGALLLWHGADVPGVWWALAGVAVSGVAGADIVSAVKRPKEADDARNVGA